MKKVCVINGVNLNLTGIREPEVYGRETLQDINSELAGKAAGLGFEISFFQSNFEGAIVDKLQELFFEKYDGIVINPGAFAHYSYAIRDAVSSIAPIPVVEVHMSNLHKREEFRHTSVIAPACAGQLCGFGADSYILGLLALDFCFKTNKDSSK